MEDLPIDIHISKLADWLISRRHCSKDWASNVSIVREKIGQAIKDMPEHPKIVELLSGTSINYFHCCKIADILKQTEVDSRNLFGQYSSQRIKDWKEILKLYESNGTYLGDAAQTLHRYCAYEVPSLKKQLAKYQQLIEEAVRKELEFTKLSKEMEKQFQRDCEKSGLSGGNLRVELLQLALELPQFYDSMVLLCRSLAPAIGLYKNYRCNYSNILPQDCLSLLQFIVANGNVTYLEWKTGEKPAMNSDDILMQRFNSLKATCSSQTNVEDVIDFDFDDSEYISNDQATLDDVVILSSEPSVYDIKDDICDDDAVLLLFEHRESQQQLTMDLLELDAFLRGILFDIRTERTASLSITSSVIENQHLPMDVIESSRSTLKAILAKFHDAHVKDLIHIRMTPSFVDTVANQFLQKDELKKKYANLASLMTARQLELQDGVADSQRQLSVVMQQGKELERQIELEISKAYKNRPVNIMGGMSTVSV